MLAAFVPKTEIAAEGRLVALDSLRGLAAVIVVIDHCLLTFGWTKYLDHFGIRLTIAGPGAVVLFFVLSGMVLAKTFIDKDRRYLPYIIKRIARVYLPFATVIVMAAFLSWVVGHAQLPTTSVWFNGWGWHSAVTPSLVFDHLRMNGQAIELDNAIWSLVHEMRLAIILPVIALATQRNWKATLAGSWLIAALVALLERLYVRPDALPWWPNTIIYGALFATGAALALVGRPLLQRLQRMTGAVQAALIALALLLLSYSKIGLFAIPLGKPFLMLFVQTVSAAIILAFAMTGCWMTRVILEHPVPRYLGRISYSLYLVHLVVLQVMVRMGESHLPHFVTIALVLPISIIAAHILRDTVEVGSQRLGRFLAKMVTKDERPAQDGFGSAA